MRRMLYLLLGAAVLAGCNSDDDYDAWYATTSVGYAISRHLDAGARYWYTHHRFDRTLSLPTDLLFQTGRHGVSAYLTAWIPLMSRARRP